jgi:cystathionine beta-lyase family protein involved in aluminum resistance
MGDFKSVGSILRGDGSNGGFHHKFTTLAPGVTVTVGPSVEFPGGTYVSVGGTEAGKQTLVLKNGQVIKRA